MQKPWHRRAVVSVRARQAGIPWGPPAEQVSAAPLYVWMSEAQGLVGREVVQMMHGQLWRSEVAS